ncbi:MAG: hypothetical protein V7724_07405 [Sediminicola sp.]
MIRSYYTDKGGYHPFLINDGWQLAQLNYSEEQHIDQLDKLDVHLETDEVFVLLKGRAALIGAKMVQGRPQFNIEVMEPGIIYNVPQNTWHNIAMEMGSEVLIVEKSYTHISDAEFFPLDTPLQNELRDLVTSALKSSK